MKIILKDQCQKIVIERSAESLPQVLQLMEDALRALGFCFEGRLEILAAKDWQSIK